ncbi:MAG: tetratricopeptide repeat protein [Patescibacteria group bacterium]
MKLSRSQGVSVIVGIVLVCLGIYALYLGAQSHDPYKGLVTEKLIEIDEPTREYFEQRLATTLAAIAATEAANEDVELNLYLSASSDAYLLGDLVMAREMLEKQLAGNSINYVAWNNYALVLEDMEDYENAEDAFVKTLEIQSGVQKYYADFANFLLAHFPERREDLKHLYEDDLARRGQTVWNMTGLGDWYAAGGECALAVDHYEVAVALDPNTQALKDDFEMLKTSCVATD